MFYDEAKMYKNRATNMNKTYDLYMRCMLSCFLTNVMQIWRIVLRSSCVL